MARKFLTREQMFDMFCKDARHLGDGMYSIWAPGGRIYHDDTANLFDKWLERFDKSGNHRYNLETVREIE